ncbi:unnamed protein product [Arabidopsis arenosa]|uniref:Uncharacterized protein n=1 Tax=Arabidopsis arenosa TaxID=38785 RepID=A0A8S2A9D1_ARAAE|nr:unnamed protein product [Arabidopsis arenosa]
MPNENIADVETVKPMIHVVDIEATLLRFCPYLVKPIREIDQRKASLFVTQFENDFRTAKTTKRFRVSERFGISMAQTTTSPGVRPGHEEANVIAYPTSTAESPGTDIELIQHGEKHSFRACGGATAETAEIIDETTEASSSAEIFDVDKIIDVDEIIYLDDE